MQIDVLLNKVSKLSEVLDKAIKLEKEREKFLEKCIKILHKKNGVGG